MKRTLFLFVCCVVIAAAFYANARPAQASDAQLTIYPLDRHQIWITVSDDAVLPANWRNLSINTAENTAFVAVSVPGGFLSLRMELVSVGDAVCTFFKFIVPCEETVSIRGLKGTLRFVSTFPRWATLLDVDEVLLRVVDYPQPIQPAYLCESPAQPFATCLKQIK